MLTQIISQTEVENTLFALLPVAAVVPQLPVAHVVPVVPVALVALVAPVAPLVPLLCLYVLFVVIGSHQSLHISKIFLTRPVLVLNSNKEWLMCEL